MVATQSSIDAVSAVYDVPWGVTLSQHSVSYSNATSAVAALRNLRGIISEDATDDVLAGLVRTLSRYQFGISATPLPTNHPAIYDSVGLARARVDATRLNMIFNAYAAPATTAVEAFQFVADDGETPILTRILELIPTISNGRTALLLKEPSHVSPVESHLTDIGLTSDIDVRVVAPRDLRGTTCYDHLIVVGPLHRLPHFVVSAPRAEDIHVVRLSCIRDVWSPSNAFLAPIKSSFSSRGFASTVQSPDEHEDIMPNAQIFESIERFADAGTPGDDRDDDVETRVYMLTDDLVVLLETDLDSTALVIDPDDDESPIQRIQSREIQAGMFVLLRTEGGGDYIVPVADQILGARAPILREKQKHWKEKLRAAARSQGLLGVAIELLDHGSTCANEQNVRNWMSLRGICTHDKADFHAIMHVVDLSGESDDYWNAMGQIRSAHRQAGNEIRRKLLQQVRDSNLEDLERAGRMDFELPGVASGALTAFRVEQILPATLRVAPHRTDRPFRLDDVSWLA